MTAELCLTVLRATPVDIPIDSELSVVSHLARLVGCAKDQGESGVQEVREVRDVPTDANTATGPAAHYAHLMSAGGAKRR